MKDEGRLSVHLSLEITVNQDSGWSWTSPKTTSNIRFSIPVEMMDGSNLAKMVDKEIKKLVGDFPEAVAEAEKAEAEKAKAEAEKVKAEV